MFISHRFLLGCVVLAASTYGIAAPAATLKCEDWHPRLGQLADKIYKIDFDAKTCGAQPCAISDAEFKWQDQNGQVEVTINRASGEGVLMYRGELTSNYKGCKLTTA